jgi:hypothetical protein
VSRVRYHFRNEAQRAAVCRRFLATVGLTELWGDRGPKSTAWRPLISGAALPPYETLFVLAAWHVWVDDDLTRLASAFELLDPRLAEGVRALDTILRNGPIQIDDWLASGLLVADPSRRRRPP